ncbi:MAG: GNAT family N-acetyltransferase [Kofleriaceae bacterium]|nr:GNAT family N-acetyltransferase [Kofleriaceae bacterium]
MVATLAALEPARPPAARDLLRASCAHDRAAQVAEEKLFGVSPRGAPVAFAARKGGILIGVAATCGDRVRLVAVHPAARGEGVGSQLLARARPRCRGRRGGPGCSTSPATTWRRASTWPTSTRSRGWAGAATSGATRHQPPGRRPHQPAGHGGPGGGAGGARRRARLRGATGAPRRGRGAVGGDLDRLRRGVAVRGRAGAGQRPAQCPRRQPRRPAGRVRRPRRQQRGAGLVRAGRDLASSTAGQGLGEALLVACLIDIAAAHPTAEIAWIGPREFYQRAVGAVGERTFAVMTATAPSSARRSRRRCGGRAAGAGVAPAAGSWHRGGVTRAMILCAGHGTRLGALSDERPAPMLPVCDVPILRYGVAHLVAHGIRDLVINLHHRGDVIEQDLGDGGARSAPASARRIRRGGPARHRRRPQHARAAAARSRRRRRAVRVDERQAHLRRRPGRAARRPRRASGRAGDDGGARRVPDAEAWGAVDAGPARRRRRRRRAARPRRARPRPAHRSAASTSRARAWSPVTARRRGLSRSGRATCRGCAAARWWRPRAPRRLLRRALDARALPGEQLGPARRRGPDARRRASCAASTRPRTSPPPRPMRAPVRIGPGATVGAGATVPPYAVIGAARRWRRAR